MILVFLSLTTTTSLQNHFPSPLVQPPVHHQTFFSPSDSFFLIFPYRFFSLFFLFLFHRLLLHHLLPKCVPESLQEALSVRPSIRGVSNVVQHSYSTIRQKAKQIGKSLVRHETGEPLVLSVFPVHSEDGISSRWTNIGKWLPNGSSTSSKPNCAFYPLPLQIQVPKASLVQTVL